MHPLQNMLLSTIIVLVGYLLYQQQQMLNVMVILQQQATSSDLVKTALVPLTEKITAIQNVTNQLGKDAEERQKQKLNKINNRIKLYQALTLVEQANRSRANNNGEEAAQTLQATKAPIWQSSTELSNYTGRLQALMSPIDQLSAAWKNHDTQTAPDAIRQELETILGELNNDK